MWFGAVLGVAGLEVASPGISYWARKLSEGWVQI